ncbi:MAG: radical SAM protein, partial [Planctomycetes bacterium]|nr:radical SAM protein [Planctomycetota bacterium]
CTFCSVTCMFGRRYRYRSTGNVIAELEQYDPRKHYLFFYDDNFTSNRNRAKMLLKEMIDLNLGFSWVTQVRSDLARDTELLDLMKKAGCTSLFIGFESVDPENLREMKKSQSPEEMERAIREIRKRKILIHGMFVFGFDADTPGKAESTVDFAIKKKIDTTQFMILTPLPGTEFFNTLKRQNRILDYQWDTYDGHHVKFIPSRFSLWELQKAQIKAHARFFALGRVILRLLRGRFRAFLIGVYANLQNKKWLKREQVYLERIKASISSITSKIKGKRGFALDR